MGAVARAVPAAAGQVALHRVRPPGFRCVHRTAGRHQPEALVDDLFTVLDALNVERCVLAGESLGALTCALAVLRDPHASRGS